jgi:hypothetical protein
MRSSGIPTIVEQSKGPKAVSPLRNNRSMLEVPSLSTPRPQPDSTGSSQPNKRPRYAIGGWSSRPQDGSDASGWGRFYSEAQQVGMRHVSRQYTDAAYDPRYQMGHTGQPYSPSPQVTRSGRGTRRMGLSRPASAQAAPSTAAPRASFPVSNRGKGNRMNMVCRSSIPTATTPSSDRNSPVTAIGITEITRVGAVQQGVAMAVSRKTKRKLPLAQKQF